MSLKLKASICCPWTFSVCSNIQAHELMWQFQISAGTSVSHGSSTGQQLEWGLPVVAALSAVVFVVVAVVLLGVCTDCYKSEVSSDFHPATAHTEVRWGGAAGYTAAPTSDPVLSSGFAEDLGTGGSQALPYTMIPSQVPESQGFRGYGTSATPATQGLSGYSMAPPPGPTGYTGNQGSQHLPGAHISPASAPEPDEPPPSYSALSNY